MFKNLLAATALTFAVMTMSVGTANALTLTTNGPINAGIIPISVGNVYTMEIDGVASDNAGSYSFGFLATSNLLSIETNSLNPNDNDGFIGSLVQWSTGSFGTGSVLGTISGAALAAGNKLFLPLIAGQTYWLTASWTDVLENGSNFDLRVKASGEVPGVPVPPALLLLGTGLLGMGALARRRKAAK